jgi:hypothetical protein
LGEERKTDEEMSQKLFTENGKEKARNDYIRIDT